MKTTQIIACTLVVLFMVALAEPSLADTTWVAAGDVSGTWTANGSPYLVSGGISVAQLDTLRIEAGVQVLFLDYGWVEVVTGGALIATGTATDSVVFTNGPGSAPWWRGITSAPDATLEFAYCRMSLSRGTGTPMKATGCRVRLEHSEFSNCVTDYVDQSGIGGIAAFIGCDVELRSCRFEANWPIGGTLWFGNECVATVEDCVIRESRYWGGEHFAGGICIGSGTMATVRRCVIEDNDGEGISVGEADALIDSCTIRDNHSASPGGGIYVGSSNARITNCLISGNHSEQDGGGVYVSYGEVQIDHCIIAGNSAAVGGGLATTYYPVLTISRTTIVENSVTASGSAIEMAYPDYTVLTSCVIARNTGAAAVANPPSAIWNRCGVFYNCFFENPDGNFAQNPDPDALGVVSRVNDNRDSCDVLYNLYQDPGLLDLEGGDYRLSEDSPCIDAGQHSLPRDPDSTFADIGAFYYHHTVRADEPGRPVPEFALGQNYPNPFNATTTIPFELARAERVTITVFDLTGRMVTTLFDGQAAAGGHVIRWNAAAEASGVYFCQLKTQDRGHTQKLLLLK